MSSWQESEWRMVIARACRSRGGRGVGGPGTWMDGAGGLCGNRGGGDQTAFEMGLLIEVKMEVEEL